MDFSEKQLLLAQGLVSESGTYYPLDFHSMTATEFEPYWIGYIAKHGYEHFAEEHETLRESVRHIVKADMWERHDMRQHAKALADDAYVDSLVNPKPGPAEEYAGPSRFAPLWGALMVLLGSAWGLVLVFMGLLFFSALFALGDLVIGQVLR